MSRYKWSIVVLLILFWGLVGLNRLGISYILPPLNREFHLQLWQDGLLVSGTSITWAVSTLVSGWLSDHFGRRKVLVPGVLLTCLFTALMGAAWNFWSMFVVRDLIGIGDGVGWPNGQAIVAEEVPVRHRSLVQGMFTAGYPFFGSVIGAIIITTLTVTLGWRWAFPIIGGAFLIMAWALWKFLREPARPAVAERLDVRAYLRVVRDPRMILLMLIQIGALAWLVVGVLYQTLWLTEVRHLSLVQAGGILSIVGAVGIVGTLLLPWLSDYLGRRPVMFGGGALCAACLILYIYGGFSLPVAVALLALNSFFVGVLVPLGSATCIVEMVGTDLSATAMGTVNFAGATVGTLAIPVLAGIVGTHWGMAAGYLIAAICAAVAGFLALALPETAPRRTGGAAEPVAGAVHMEPVSTAEHPARILGS